MCKKIYLEFAIGIDALFLFFGEEGVQKENLCLVTNCKLFSYMVIIGDLGSAP